MPDLFFGDGHVQTGDEIAATIKHTRKIINTFKEKSAPQAEAA